MEDEEREDFLHGAGATGESDEGIGVLDHHLHPGVDIRARPEAAEPLGQAFEGDDVGHVGAAGPAAVLGGASDDLTHDAALAGTGDAADICFGEQLAKRVAVFQVTFLLDGGGAEDADVEAQVGVWQALVAVAPLFEFDLATGIWKFLAE